ncbi:MAG: FKBP-type peptidyl-prolyl cis-trans isomerase [Clostridia bacterium]|nr:FKBP-type peptidyl-prolyl cis-trans isomerase [Clostridia bacterium]
MKKTAIIALLLAALLVFTGCSPATYSQVDPEKYVTLGEYKGLSYTAVEISVSDYELQVAVNEELKNSGYVSYQEDITLTEGTVRLGDTVNINYKGLKDGVAFEGGTADNQSLTIGSGSFIDGFEEGLVGKAIGSDVKLNLTFPENYGNEELAGQDVIFEVKINSVTERADYKELTDDLAHTIKSEVNTAAEFREAVKAELEAEKKADAETSIKDELWTATIENATLAEKLPEKLVEGAEEEFIAYYETLALQYSYDDLSAFLAGNSINEDTFYAQAESYGRSIVESQLVAYAIAKAEGYTPTQEALDKSAEEYATTAGYTEVAKYVAAVGDDAIMDQHILDYAVDLVLASAVTKA